MEAVVEHSTHQPAQHIGAHDEGVELHAAAAQPLEVGQPQRTAGAAQHHGEEEVSGDDQQTLLAPDVVQSALQLGLQVAEAGPLGGGAGVGFLSLDLGFKDGGDKEAHGVEGEQGGETHGVVDVGGHGHHDGGEGIDEAGDGVGLGEVSLADQQGIKAVVGHLVDAVNGADEHAQQKEGAIAEKPP